MPALFPPSAAARASRRRVSAEATSRSDTPACLAVFKASSSRVAFATWNGSGIAAPSTRSASLTALAFAGFTAAGLAPTLREALALAFATACTLVFAFAFGAAAAAALALVGVRVRVRVSP